MYTHHNLLSIHIHLSMDFNCFCLLAITLWTCVHKHLSEIVFNYLGYKHGSGITGSRSHSNFSFLKNCYTVFYIILCSHQHCTGAPISPHPLGLSFILLPIGNLLMKQLLNQPYIPLPNTAKASLASLELPTKPQQIQLNA